MYMYVCVHVYRHVSCIGRYMYMYMYSVDTVLL